MVFHRGKRKTDLDSPSLNHIHVSLKKFKFTHFLSVIFDDQLRQDKIRSFYFKHKRS